MRVALYARVSTTDKSQDPTNQLVPLRAWVAARPGWSITHEYVDCASALDLAHRTAWRELLDDAARRRFDVVACWKLDRAFRSVAHLHQTISAWELVNVSLVSTTESWDTSTAAGRLLMNILVSLSEFERGLIAERVQAGLDRAKRQGKRLGRPPAIRRPRVEARWPEVRVQVLAGTLSTRQAAKLLGVSASWVSRHVREGDTARSSVAPGTATAGPNAQRQRDPVRAQSPEASDSGTKGGPDSP